MLRVAGYLLAGVLVGWLAVVVARALDIAPDGQRLIAFVCVGAALIIAAVREDLAESGPVAVVATLIGVTTAVVAALSYIGPIEQKPALGCINTHGHINATISGDTVVYSGATAASSPKRLLLKGCDVHAIGYCIGTPHTDALEPGVRDARWLILEDHGGLVPSGRTVGTTPRKEKPRHCKQGLPPPKGVTLKGAVVDQRAKRVSVQATAPHAALIGFAVRRPDGSWLRLGWDITPEDGVPQVMLAPPEAVPATEVAAVACVGFQRPSGAIAMTRLRAGRIKDVKVPAVLQPPPAGAAEAACNSGTK